MLFFQIGMRTWTSLLLLLSLGLALGLGAHPCAAQGAPAPVAPSARPSCHTHAEPSATLEPGSRHPDCCGSERGSGQPCPHLCHATALPVAATPPLQSDLTARPLLAVGGERPLAAPVRAIDHVPLG
ncbi:MAG TPA: hypothetical protein DD490_27810 [Acidobacteria bacterium]|nr:hypothetical protein [Acidobacteriota bacterium]